MYARIKKSNMRREWSAVTYLKDVKTNKLKFPFTAEKVVWANRDVTPPKIVVILRGSQWWRLEISIVLSSYYIVWEYILLMYLRKICIRWPVRLAIVSNSSCYYNWDSGKKNPFVYRRMQTRLVC